MPILFMPLESFKFAQTFVLETQSFVLHTERLKDSKTRKKNKRQSHILSDLGLHWLHVFGGHIGVPACTQVAKECIGCASHSYRGWQGPLQQPVDWSIQETFVSSSSMIWTNTFQLGCFYRLWAPIASRLSHFFTQGVWLLRTNRVANRQY